MQNITTHAFDNQGTVLILKTVENTLQRLNLLTGDLKTIWSANISGFKIESYGIDEKGSQVAFLLSINRQMINLRTSYGIIKSAWGTLR